MGNVSTPNSPVDYLEQKRKNEERLITIIAVVVMICFAALLAYMFFGNH